MGVQKIVHGYSPRLHELLSTAVASVAQLPVLLEVQVAFFLSMLEIVRVCYDCMQTVRVVDGRHKRLCCVDELELFGFESHVACNLIHVRAHSPDAWVARQLLEERALGLDL